jgi:uncharacterized protein (UPF0332 family)
MREEDLTVLVRRRMEQARAALQEARLLVSAGATTLGAVNRSYYAMFYAVLALLQLKKVTPRKHAGAIALFDSEFVRTGLFPKHLSARLHMAFEARQESDYHVVEPLSVADTEELIESAEWFVQAVEDYLGAFL